VLFFTALTEPRSPPTAFSAGAHGYAAQDAGIADLG
jgi:hypothetical protein